MNLETVAIALLAYVLLKPKKSSDPRGQVDIGEPTIGSNPSQWAQYPTPMPAPSAPPLVSASDSSSSGALAFDSDWTKYT